MKPFNSMQANELSLVSKWTHLQTIRFQIIYNGKETDSMEKNLKNKVIQKWWVYYKRKSPLKRFGFTEPSSGL